MKKYSVSDVFWSLQGEGAMAGTSMVFIRFQGCNLACRVERLDFDCDTDFASGSSVTMAELVNDVLVNRKGAEWCLLTGGEPLLQADDALIEELHGLGLKIAVETNGTKEIPDGIDYVTVSPKVAEHAVRAQRADELRYVRGPLQRIPEPKLAAKHMFISPAFIGDQPDRGAVSRCVNLVRENPSWRLSIQSHKLIGIA